MSHGSCAVCGSGEMRMSGVVIEGRSLTLCRLHAATVVAAMPETFEDLRALFAGVIADDRRSPIDRRDPLDRRAFPPRPEGRRVGRGRRASEPME